MIKSAKKNYPVKKKNVTRTKNVQDENLAFYRRFASYMDRNKEQMQSLMNVDGADLPSRYNQTYLTLMVRDPHWLHAYWEITPEDVEKMKSRLGENFSHSRYTLRMYDTTLKNFNGRNANHSFDVDLPLDTNNWYVDLWVDNVTYCSEIGVRTPQGDFHPFAQSNAASTPRESFSPRSELMWMDVKENRQDSFVYTTARKNRLEKAVQKAGHLFPEGKNFSRKMYLTEDDIRAYYANLFPLLSRLRPGRNTNGRGKSLTSKDAGMEQGSILVEDAGIPGLFTRYDKKFLKAGASAELVEEKGASEQISSGASAQEKKHRSFFFELWTELIVHGRTKPDAEVTHGTKKVPLRPDGTFTLRFGLPDGKIPLDFLAVSQDKLDSRRITTSVERTRTIYSP